MLDPFWGCATHPTAKIAKPRSSVGVARKASRWHFRRTPREREAARMLPRDQLLDERTPARCVHGKQPGTCVLCINWTNVQMGGLMHRR
jgi:hypothetical protein